MADSRDGFPRAMFYVNFAFFLKPQIHGDGFEDINTTFEHYEYCITVMQDISNVNLRQTLWKVPQTIPRDPFKPRGTDHPFKGFSNQAPITEHSENTSHGASKDDEWPFWPH